MASYKLFFGYQSTSLAGRTADLAVTLGDAALAAVVTNVINAAAAQTLGAVTLSSAATNAITAALAVTLGDATLSAEGVVSSSADLDITLDAATPSAAATNAIAASSTVTLGTIALSAASANAISAALAITLDAATISATADTGAARTATLDQTLGDATIAATGTVTQPASTSQPGTGQPIRRRRAAPAVPSFIGIGDAQQRIQAAVAVTLGDATLFARATMGEAPLARKRRRTLAMLTM